MANSLVTRWIIIILSCFILTGIGLWISSHKPLWNDEIYSLNSSVVGMSYQRIWAGQVGEGNNFPLFYVTQKFFLELIGYHIPQPWLNGDWGYNDKPSQFSVRILPILYMVLAVSVSVVSLWRWVGWQAGIFAMGLWMGSYMLWAYWAEARPYNLLMLTTSCGMAIMLQQLKTQSPRPQWVKLGVCHVMASLTSVFALPVIISFSIGAWFNRCSKLFCAIVLLIIPCLSIAFYYTQAPHYEFYFNLTPEQLLRDNISRERFYIVAIAIICWFITQRPFKLDAFMKVLLTVGSSVLATIGLLIYLSLTTNHEQRGFPITSRYFIYLTPLGIALTAIAFQEVYQRTAPLKYLQWAWIGLCLYWVIVRFNKIGIGAIKTVLYH